MEEVRKFRFSLREAQSDRGVIKVFGRASRKDPNRIAQRDNLFYDERSLSRNHALLGIKLMEPLADGITMDQFRIYVKDLESTYGIVDLNSQESDPFVIDLKNGERFGLIKLNNPISVNQRRGAKLKFQIDVDDVGEDEFECRVSDVSFDDSPLVTRPSTCDNEIEFLSMLQGFSPSDSESESESEGTPCAPNDDMDSVSENSFYSETSESYALVNLYTLPKVDIWDEDDEESDVRKEDFKVNEERIGNKRPLPDADDEDAQDEGQDIQFRPNKRAKTGIVSKRDIITGTIGFLLGSVGTIGFLIGIAGRLE
ncbi:hypothetical protein ZYGR_0AD01100 [Zygosaccharomyces rouxii]|uniref:ZYRO0G08404p n=2 Tax=Zygosaccharomyces rouxii TaxID=4956 RepID=C5DZZ4_ZYGRC|nr:uncharacterized protein ZYRO0G08404g [Zygosaccharomyces rouxii]KAH9202423.1 hypothetical protein LQ764DRAFT_232602 [Zygosaccharomyces rouxii]GAV50927.1 hypothetical protein ZYGR_0AD01100 [Zygosaccharomyces rouxii]CAR29428.1 ZYRO0G08404p [Zygosaccharomyces rouxii]